MTGIVNSTGARSGVIGAATFPAGHIIKTTFVLRTGGTLEVDDNTITTACSIQYECDDSSNKLLLMGLGVIGRGTGDGMGSMYYYLDAVILSGWENRDFKDSDEMPIHNCTLDGYSGAKDIYFKIKSLSDDEKVLCADGNGFVILEIQQ